MLVPGVWTLNSNLAGVQDSDRIYSSRYAVRRYSIAAVCDILLRTYLYSSGHGGLFKIY